jgi:hypothetical protein
MSPIDSAPSDFAPDFAGPSDLGWRTSTITRYIETRENIANSTFT